MPEQTVGGAFASELKELRDLIERLKDRPNKSRELSVSLTNLETGELWLQKAGEPRQDDN